MNEYEGEFIGIEGKGRILITEFSFPIESLEVGGLIKVNDEISKCRGFEYFKANSFKSAQIGILC